MTQRNISSGKIYKYADRLCQLKEGKGVTPICVEVHLTMACQQKCRYCTFKGKSMTANLDYGVLKTTLGALARNGCVSLLWSGGGDPTMYRQGMFGLADVIHMAGALGFKQGLYTNGESLTLEMMEEAVHNCTFVRISVDAFTSKVYKKLHNSQGYAKVLQNLKTLLMLKEKSGSSIDIGVSYVIYRENMFDIFRAKQFLEQIHPDYIYFRPGVYPNTKAGDLRIQKKIVGITRRLCSGVKAQFEYSTAKTNQLLCPRPREYTRCFAGNLFPTISSNGGIYVCCHHIQNPNYEIGNLYRQSIEDIFTRPHVTSDIQACPVNCRGDILNQDVDHFMRLLENTHTDFL